MNIENLDELIKKYKDALDEMGKIYGGESQNENIDSPLNEQNGAKETLSEEETSSYSKEEEEPLNDADTAEIEGFTSESENEPYNETSDDAPSVIFPEGEATSFSYFIANVFSGDEVYPVEGAKVVVYRGDNIYAFLSTDENGKTERIRLPAFEKENSLEADNPDKTVEYQADVFAEGFNAQKGLVVSAVGESEILLRVILVPENERIG